MCEDIIPNWRGCVERNGYIFTNVTYPGNIYDAIFIRNIKCDDVRYRGFPNSTYTIDEHIAYINKMQVEKAVVFASNLEFLKRLPSLKHLNISLFIDGGIIDYKPLYEMQQIKSLVINSYNNDNLPMAIDYSRIHGLIDLHISGKGHTNFERIVSLRSLGVSQCKNKSLKELFVSKQLDTLFLMQCSIHSLDGIDQSEKMQCLYLHYNRSLRDISALSKVKKTLRALRIENCPKIEDFSVLEELENLELLELTGKNTIPSLQFIKQLKNLKTFIFDMDVLDGDLTPCLDLSYVYSRKNRKHYNVKDKDLPKGKYIRGNEDIELWRRME